MTYTASELEGTMKDQNMNTRRIILGSVGATAAVLAVAASPAGATPTDPPVSSPAWFNVLDYGVSVNSLNSDSTAGIQSAINAANSNNATEKGGCVYIPAGQYRIDGTLTLRPGIHLRGDGYGTQLFSGSNSKIMILVPNIATQAQISELRLVLSGKDKDKTGNTGITLGDSTSPKWWAYGETPHIVEHVSIEDNTGKGVHVTEQAIGVMLDSVKVYAKAGIGGVGFLIEGTETSMTACLAHGHKYNGYRVNRPNGTASRSRLNGCEASNNTQKGFLIEGQETMLSACSASGNSGDGIVVAASRTVINGCIASWQQSGAGLYVASMLADVSVAGVVASNNARGVEVSGNNFNRVFIAGLSSGNTTNWTIGGNPGNVNHDQLVKA